MRALNNKLHLSYKTTVYLGIHCLGTERQTKIAKLRHYQNIGPNEISPTLDFPVSSGGPWLTLATYHCFYVTWEKKGKHSLSEMGRNTQNAQNAKEVEKVHQVNVILN